MHLVILTRNERKMWNSLLSLLTTKEESDDTAHRDKPFELLLKETQNNLYPVLNIITKRKKVGSADGIGM